MQETSYYILASSVRVKKAFPRSIIELQVSSKRIYHFLISMVLFPQQQRYVCVCVYVWYNYYTQYRLVHLISLQSYGICQCRVREVLVFSRMRQLFAGVCGVFSLPGCTADHRTDKRYPATEMQNRAHNDPRTCARLWPLCYLYAQQRKFIKE